MVNPQEWHGKALQIHGYAKDVARARATRLTYQFNIQNNGKVVRAYVYGRRRPTPSRTTQRSSSRAGSRENNTFHATEIIAKCPSKYDPAGRRHAGTE